MSTIAKCTALTLSGGCPFRYACKRYTAPAKPRDQEWMQSAPYVEITHSCKEYISNKPVNLEPKTEAQT